MICIVEAEEKHMRGGKFSQQKAEEMHRKEWKSCSGGRLNIFSIEK